MESGFPDSPGYGSIVTGSERQAAIDRRPQARTLERAASRHPVRLAAGLPRFEHEPALTGL